MKFKKYAGVISLFIVIATVYWSFQSLTPSKISGLNEPVTQFSSERALIHLKELAKKPHFTGTLAHDEVRVYLKKELEKLGLEVEIQEQLGINQSWRSGTVTKNILTRIKGAEQGKSLLLLSHYDSNPHSSLGASDAGSGVVTILEGIRAFLASNAEHKNDIIILFSDAEEIGLNGANAFVNHHPWAKDVGLVLNFEARGSGGPSYMLMETNGKNQKLFSEFLKAKPNYPVASSLMYSLYKMLPNDTDLTVFREDGDINGFNFAFIGDHFDYHTAQDSYERLDRNSLEQQGDYLMSLLPHFANLDLSNLNSDKDNVYVNFPGIKMISYPFSWVVPMLIIATLIFLGLLFFGLAHGKLSVRGIVKGFVPFTSALLINGLIGFLGWKILLNIHPQYQDILHGFTYNGYEYIATFSALTIAITLTIYGRFSKKKNRVNNLVAPLFFWLLVNLIIALYLKGGGFFIIPVYFALGVLFLLMFVRMSKLKKSVVITLLSIPLLVIFSPMVKMLPVGLGLKILFVSAVFIVLVMGLMTPLYSYTKKRNKVSYIFYFFAIVGFIIAWLKADYSIDRKQPNSILYVLDADTNEAYWKSYNAKVDDWTQQFLGENPSQGSVDKTAAASKYKTHVKLYKKTAVKPIALPQVDLYKNDTLSEKEDFFKVKILPQRKVNRIELIAQNNIHFKSFKVNGQGFQKKKGDEYVFATDVRKQVLNYYITSEGESLEIEFSTPKGEQPELMLYESSYDLFANKNFEIQPRNEIMMPMPFVLNDAIVVKKRLNFE